MLKGSRSGAVGAAPRPKGKTDLADCLPTTSPTHAAQSAAVTADLSARVCTAMPVPSILAADFVERTGAETRERRPVMTSGFKAKAALSERGDDLYETPAVAVTALLERETLASVVWEPACGPGAIVGVLRAAGHTVIATDLNDWGCPDSEARRNFLFEQRAPDGCECIITNPPYKFVQKFVLKARELVPKVVMLLRLGFLESERRRNILESGDLARVYVFRNRLPDRKSTRL